MENEKLGLGSFSKGNYLDNDINNINNAERILQSILDKYGKDYIIGIVANYIKSKNQKHRQQEILACYDYLLSTHKGLSKKDVRLITAKCYSKSEKTIQRYITQRNKKKSSQKSS